MADHFLTKTRIALADCLDVGGRPAIEQFEALEAYLNAQVPPSSAALFAEPLISKGNDEAPPTVAWYSVHEGEGARLSDLDGASQQAAEAALAQALAPLAPHLSAEGPGAILGAALHQLSGGDIWVVAGKPVIVNWGMMPASQGREQGARAAHYAQGLGRFLPLAKAPPIAAGEASAPAPSTASAASGPAPVAAAAMPAAGGRAAPPPPTAPVVAASGGRLPLMAWLPLVILLLIAGATLAWLTLPGTRLFAQDGTQNAIQDEAALALAQEVNRNLAERRATLQQALDGAVCRADGTLILPGDRTIEGLLPPVPGNPQDAPGSQTAALPEAVLTPDPDRVVVPQPDASGALTQGSLLELIEARTVMVLAVAPGGGLGVGTGFVVGPGLIVTNHHVIEDVGTGTVFITNPTLGALQEAQVLKTFGPLETLGGDFALVRIADTSLPAFSLYNGTGTMRLQNVIAAGYPGDVLETDAAFQALRAGDASAVPGLTVTDGAVNTEQQLSPTTNVLVHSAPISQGNSGGPLIDMCGRIVGVNTFVRQGPMRNLNFALAVPDLLTFLEGTPVQPAAVSAACAPQVLRPSAPVAEAAPAPAPAPATAPATAPAAPDASPPGVPALPVFE